MTMIRRERPRSKCASSRPCRLSHKRRRGFSFRHRPISSGGQRRPQKSSELARHGRHDLLFRFAPCGKASEAAVQSMLGVPRLLDDRWRGSALPEAERAATKWVMAIVPGGVDQYPSQMSVARFGDAAAHAGRPAGMLGRDEAGKGHQPRRRRESACVPELRRDGEGSEIIDAAETSQSSDARAERLERQEIPELRIDGLKSGPRFLDGARVGAMRLLEGRQGPALCVEPRRMTFRPRLFRGREAPAMAQQKLGEPMARAEKIRANIFATAEQIARRFFLLAGNVNRDKRTGAVQHGELARIAPIRLDAIAGAPRDQCWRDDLTRNVVLTQRTLELEAAGTSFVAALNGRGPQSLHESQNGRTV
jgi:hypothetical protein